MLLLLLVAVVVVFVLFVAVCDAEYISYQTKQKNIKKK
jgi:hypothetical protein